MQNSQTHIAWHPAFIQALQMELDEYRDILEFYVEFQLTYEPLKIDCVIVKKTKDVRINKNIAAIFREWNIVEYKSPTDYVSIEDYYKVYGYACLYAALKKTPINTLTISIVQNHQPKKLLKYLQQIYGYTVDENSQGIYTISGDIIPIQIIDRSKLSLKENLWLKGLSNCLEPAEFTSLTETANRLGKARQIAAYVDAIARANINTMEEMIKMKNKKTLEQVFEDAGWIAKWEARGETKGEERKALDIARNMVNLGLPFDTVISATMLEPEKVKAMYQEQITGN